MCVTKHQFIEEPCEVKVSSTVLKTSGYREVLAEFNEKKAKEPLPESTTIGADAAPIV